MTQYESRESLRAKLMPERLRILNGEVRNEHIAAIYAHGYELLVRIAMHRGFTREESEEMATEAILRVCVRTVIKQQPLGPPYDLRGATIGTLKNVIKEQRRKNLRNPLCRRDDTTDLDTLMQFEPDNVDHIHDLYGIVRQTAACKIENPKHRLMLERIFYYNDVVVTCLTLYATVINTNLTLTEWLCGFKDSKHLTPNTIMKRKFRALSALRDEVELLARR